MVEFANTNRYNLQYMYIESGQKKQQGDEKTRFIAVNMKVTRYSKEYQSTKQRHLIITPETL